MPVMHPCALHDPIILLFADFPSPFIRLVNDELTNVFLAP